MLISFEWKDLAKSIEKKVTKLLNGIKLQYTDDNLKVLLRYALGLGNYLNGQSARGGR